VTIKATQLPGNTTPDVEETPLPDHYGAAIDVFLYRLDQVRGKYGRDQIRSLTLVGYESIGRDLDQLDGLARRRNR
jgi:hypothetical protein